MRGVLTTLGLCCLALTGLFAVTFYQRYWRWRDCFNELGRCYDPVSEQVYLEQAGLVWGSLSGLCLVAGLGLLAWGFRRRS